MFALTLEITAIAILLMVAAVVCVFWQAARSPKGFENSDGFHFGTEPCAHSNAHGRNRAVVPAVVPVDDRPVPVPIHYIPPAQAPL